MSPAETDPGAGTEAGAETGPAVEAAQDQSRSGSRHARRGLVALLLIAALGAVALATLGASAQRGDLIISGGGTLEIRPIATPEADEEYTEPDRAVQEQVPPPPPSDGSGNVSTILIVVAAVLLGLLLLWLALRMRSLVRPPPEEAEDVPDDDLTEEQARVALVQARGRLALDVDPHHAVVSAWLSLEEAIARAGVSRDPSQTTLEFVVAVLGDLSLDRAALDRLAHLYRRALFDDVPLSEQDREEALVQLDLLAEQLQERLR